MGKEEAGLTKKQENFSEWYTQVIQKAELADIRYGVKGFLVHMPWSVRIMKHMFKVLEDELERTGHEPVWFPSVIPESFLRKEKEHAEFSADVFWVTEGGEKGRKLEERLALRPTSETAIACMFSLWIRGWRDLPLKTYQSCQVWRFESVTRPFIRGREFYWIEAHDAFATEEEALQQVKEDMQITERVMHQCFGIPFLFFKRPEHDKFKGAVDTFAADALMPDGKVIQLPSTHLLGQNFSKPFDIKFIDKDGKKKYVWQTCYGPAVWRILGAMVAIHGDDQGLILPPPIAPIQVIIVPVYYTTEERKKVLKETMSVKRRLEQNGIRAEVDDREEYTPGWKYYYWELKGVPLRAEIGPKDVKAKQVVLVRRDNRKRRIVKEKELVSVVRELLEVVQSSITKRAEKFFKEKLSEARNLKELKRILEEKGGLVRTNWCGKIKCADLIKTKTEGGSIRGTVFGREEKPFGKCVGCGKEAKEVVYIAKAY